LSTSLQIIYMPNMLQNRAADSTDFNDVLACLEDIHGGGRPEQFLVGSPESKALHARSQQDERHWQMRFPDIAKELGIVAARSTIESVFHLQHNIFRRREIHKLFLSQDHIESRLAFAHMPLQIAINTIVFTDEIWVEFNITRRKHGNVLCVVGEDRYKWAIHDRHDENTIRLIFWEAITLSNLLYSIFSQFVTY